MIAFSLLDLDQILKQGEKNLGPKNLMVSSPFGYKNPIRIRMFPFSSIWKCQGKNRGSQPNLCRNLVNIFSTDS